jgi:hypothetical protein
MKVPRIFRKSKTKINTISILSGALLFLSAQINAQDSIQPFHHSYRTVDSSLLIKKGKASYISDEGDTLITFNDTTDHSSKPKWTPEPQRATILSAVLPGLGQAYNRKYWKIPILYTGGSVLYYYYYINNESYLENRRLYEEEIAKGTQANTTKKDEYSKNFNEFRKKSQYKLMLIGVLYVANIVDAMADAYFATYDISDELAFKLRPSLSPQPFLSDNTISIGFTFNLNF